MKIKKKELKEKNFTMRIEQKTLASLERIAKECGCSVAEVIRQILAKHI